MKTTRYFQILLAVAVITLTADAQDIVTNRLSFSARFGFNISARFKDISVTSIISPPNSRTTLSGDSYNYDDGYVLTDASGNYGGQTWYWGYDNASQISGNTILLSRTLSTATGGASHTLDDRLIPGGELTYDRLLFVKSDARIGIEAALNYVNMGFHADTPFTATAMRVTDAYPFTPGTTPPGTSSGPYQGSFGGPGFLIFTNIASSTTTTTNLTSAGPGTDHQRLDANLWGFRLGPYLEVPLGEPMTLSLSAGLAVGIMDADASWSMTVGSATLSGSGHDYGVLWGGYLSGAATWALSERWSIIGGAQFQTLNNYEHSFGGRNLAVNLDNAWFATLGVSYTF
jgi:hypothetical protein